MLLVIMYCTFKKSKVWGVREEQGTFLVAFLVACCSSIERKKPLSQLKLERLKQKMVITTGPHGGTELITSDFYRFYHSSVK